MAVIYYADLRETNPLSRLPFINQTVSHQEHQRRKKKRKEKVRIGRESRSFINLVAGLLWLLVCLSGTIREQRRE